MKSPLVINVRCTCIEEYLNIQKLHKEYIRQSREGQITSIYVGADFVVPGEFEVLDALIAKRAPRQIPCVDFGDRKIEVADIRSITKKFTKEDFEELKKEIDEKSSVVSEFAVGDRAEEFHYEDEAKPDFGPATEPTHFAEEPEVAFDPNVEDYHPERGDSWKGVKAKPEITLTDVLTAMAEEPDPMEAIKTEAEGEPDGDGQDYNTTYAG